MNTYNIHCVNPKTGKETIERFPGIDADDAATQANIAGFFCGKVVLVGEHLPNATSLLANKQILWANRKIKRRRAATVFILVMALGLAAIGFVLQNSWESDIRAERDIQEIHRRANMTIPEKFNEFLDSHAK